MSRIVLIATLVVAGEMVFGLPFLVPRFFRPTLLEVFAINQTQLGDMFAVYGIVAMLSYFPGGALADHYSARLLMTASLFSTALGGLVMATIPDPLTMSIVYGFWGGSTVFLFWGALIRATRDWGGHRQQGMAFGILDAGRGVTAALVAGFATALFATLMPDNVGQATDEERKAAFQAVILTYTALTAVVGILTWFLVPDGGEREPGRPNPWPAMWLVLRRPVVWAQAGIIVFAYCAFKGSDNYGDYANKVLGMNEVDANKFTALAAWIRPVGAVAAGLIADRFDAARTIGISFAVLAVLYVLLGIAVPSTVGLNLIFANLLVSYLLIFALRGIYFALLEDNGTPFRYTGAAVGMVSFIGYSPDVFFGPISGRIIDAAPGLTGYQNYYLFLAMTAIGGVLVVAWLLRLHRLGPGRLWPGMDVEISAADTRSA